MTNRWLTGIAVAALTAAGTMAAQAADLPTRKEARRRCSCRRPSPGRGSTSVLTPAPSGAWAIVRRRFITPPTGSFLSTYYPGNLGNSNTGFIGGGQAGYNWQTGAFVLGVETDFDGTTLSKTFNYTSAPFAATTPYPGDILYVNAKANLDWLGTTRARLGFVATPDNRLMFYATGGVAYGGGSSNFSAYDAQNNILCGLAPPAAREWAGPSAAASNTPSPTTSRSRANISITTSAAPPSHVARRRPIRLPLPGRRSRPPSTPIDGSIVRAGVNYKF